MLPDELNRRIKSKKLSDARSLTIAEPLTSPNVKPLNPKKTVQIKLICDHSEELRDKFFSNRVSKKDSKSITRMHIKELMQLDNKIKLYSELPFDVRSLLESNKKDTNRISDIFSLYEIDFYNMKIYKCRYRSLLLDKTFDESLRFFIIYEPGLESYQSLIKIALIDPHHLVATENYKEIFQSNIHKYLYDIKEINHSIFD